MLRALENLDDASPCKCEVFLASEAGRWTTVTVEVPVARRGEAVLLLRVGQLRVGLPTSVVRRATRLDPTTVVERDGRTLARFPDRLVPFIPLARLYGQPAADRQEASVRPQVNEYQRPEN